MRSTARKIRGRLLGAMIAAAALLVLAGPAPASAAPELEVSSSYTPAAGVPQGTAAKYEVKVSNVGNAETAADVSVEFSVPAGLEITGIIDEIEQDPALGIPVWTCSIAPDSRSASCTDLFDPFFGPIGIPAGAEACEGAAFGILTSCHIFVTVKTGSGTPFGPALPAIEACSASATPNCASAPDNPFEVVPFAFGIESFDSQMLQEGGGPATQAGSHPHTAETELSFRTAVGANGVVHPIDGLRDATVHLPPGLVGNPLVADTCSAAQLTIGQCPSDSAVGTATIHFQGDFEGDPTVNVFNMEVPGGLPALFSFNYLTNLTMIYASVRSGNDYGIDVAAKNAPEVFPFAGVDFAFWGVPADESHDPQRCGTPTGAFASCPSNLPERPFISLPTSCVGPTDTTIDATGWEGGADSALSTSHAPGEPNNLIGNSGCNAVDFSPTLEARPTTNVADAPTGLDVHLRIPQNADPDGTAAAHLRDTTVTLPEGLAINPAGANGLDGCSLSDFGYTHTDAEGTVHTTPDPATCPDAAKQATLEIESPLVDHPLKGSVYLAEPYQNPFGSLLAIYLTVDDQETGVVVKLAGEVKADPNTGQLSTTFTRSPQLPFEDFELHFFGGAGGALRTPATCATYTTTSSLTPWTAPESGPPATPEDSWAIEQAPGGGTCPTSQGARPHTPDLDAGTITPIAAAATPAVVDVRREDGTQEFSTVNLTLPPGLTGKLAGVSSCPEAALTAAAAKDGYAEKASPSCPASSRIGVVDVAAGAGPAPYHTQGTAYLAGPYKGAPLSMAIITPATAGPFDLGTVVVRTALFVDRNSGRITAVSDPIPAILEGIPLDVRSARVHLDRPDFSRNGTSCDPSSFEGSLVSTLAQSASLTERFQLAECTGLAFKPKLSIRLIGGTKRGAHPALRGTVTMPPGGANIARASVALPHAEFLDQAHIGTVCTRVQFAAKECPAASVYGSAVATSPLVDYPLEGPAYLRSSDNELPDLVIALHGPPSQPIEVDVVGRVDSVKGGIRTTFEGVPDLPVSSFVLSMMGGKKGLLQNSTNICRARHRITAEFDGQNGKAADPRPLLKNSKCTGKKRGAKKAKRRAAR